MSEEANALEVTVPKTASAPIDGIERRLDPRSFIVRGIGMISQLGIPLVIGAFTIFDDGEFEKLAYFVPIMLVILGVNIGIAYLSWRKFTYRIGAQDIRVESGILSRAARSVPFERIQDVSLEQKLIPRLFGLVEVKFETGSGGGDDLKLSYLSEEQGEALREVVRERRDAGEEAQAIDGEGSAAPASRETGEVLFSMDTKRLFTFGMFEFSLAVFAVLGGLAQYAETFMGIELWDPDLWREWVNQQQGFISSLGPVAQVVSAIAGIVTLLVIGSVTGLARTFARDWGFVLEKTARGFRRRRGLFTKTDVVMPVHRVQALELSTRMIRRFFGWHGLKFVSLAQDAGSASHVVAPFAQREEIDPIIRAAGFEPPSPDLDWHRASRRYRTDRTLIESSFFLLGTVLAAIFAPQPFFLFPLGLAAITAVATYFGWRFHRHALDRRHIFGMRGVFSPRTQIASRVKLHSVEISQGPIAQRRGYATVHLGLAGGTFSMPGIPVDRAFALRQAITDSIAATDFSQLDQSARSSAHSGFSSNLAAT